MVADDLKKSFHGAQRQVKRRKGNNTLLKRWGLLRHVVAKGPSTFVSIETWTVRLLQLSIHMALLVGLIMESFGLFQSTRKHRKEGGRRTLLLAFAYDASLAFLHSLLNLGDLAGLLNPGRPIMAVLRRYKMLFSLITACLHVSAIFRWKRRSTEYVAPPIFPFLIYFVGPWTNFSAWLIEVQLGDRHFGAGLSGDLLAMVILLALRAYLFGEQSVTRAPRLEQRWEDRGLDNIVLFLLAAIVDILILRNDFFERIVNWKYVICMLNLVWPWFFVRRVALFFKNDAKADRPDKVAAPKPSAKGTGFVAAVRTSFVSAVIGAKTAIVARLVPSSRLPKVPRRGGDENTHRKESVASIIGRVRNSRLRRRPAGDAEVEVDERTGLLLPPKRRQRRRSLEQRMDVAEEEVEGDEWEGAAEEKEGQGGREEGHEGMEEDGENGRGKDENDDGHGREREEGEEHQKDVSNEFKDEGSSVVGHSKEGTGDTQQSPCAAALQLSREVDEAPPSISPPGNPSSARHTEPEEEKSAQGQASAIGEAPPAAMQPRPSFRRFLGKTTSSTSPLPWPSPPKPPQPPPSSVVTLKPKPAATATPASLPQLLPPKDLAAAAGAAASTATPTPVSQARVTIVGSGEKEFGKFD